jgi:hypothetical protein
MTIRNIDHFKNALWDYGFLESAFGDTRIRVSDKDGEVERNGLFLHFEFKTPGVGLPRGQEITIHRKVNRGDTVLVIWGHRQQPEKMHIWYPGSAKPINVEPATLEDIWKATNRWFLWANAAGGAPSKRYTKDVRCPDFADAAVQR